MKAYFDCASGLSGDMFLAALVDAGLPIERLSKAVESLGIDGLRLEAEKVTRLGVSATKVNVITPHEHTHRNLGDIVKIIESSGLSSRIKHKSKAIFTRLATAEAEVHGKPVEDVHFHEVGALDSIADIVAAAAGLEMMGIDHCRFSPVAVGSGTVKCAHGVLPVPAPATALLLVGVPIAESQESGELTTPTGAALVAELADCFGAMPSMKLKHVGCGAGTREGKKLPNILRVFIGEESPSASAAEVTVIEAAIDDMTPEALSYATEAIFAAGALDVYITPIVMKKGRPGHLVTVITDQSAQERVLETLFRETTTFGARLIPCRREVLEREIIEVSSEYGVFRAKKGLFRGKPVSAAPEYEDAKRIARETGQPFRLVYHSLQEAARRHLEGPPRKAETPK